MSIVQEKIVSLIGLKKNSFAEIVEIGGGFGFRKRLNIMGIRKGEKIKVISRQPFSGPITIEVCGSQMTIGRGMAHKILVEELK